MVQQEVKKKYMSTSEPDASDGVDSSRPARLVISELDRELAVAISADVPVLISGNPTASLELACELYRRSGSPSTAVVLIDCRHPSAASRIAPVILESLGGGGETRTKVLLLLEGHALGADGQEQLEERLESALLHRRATAFRVIASSSVSLYDRVALGHFRERLYYFLNMIHLVLPPGDQE